MFWAGSKFLYVISSRSLSLSKSILKVKIDGLKNVRYISQKPLKHEDTFGTLNGVTVQMNDADADEDEVRISESIRSVVATLKCHLDSDRYDDALTVLRNAQKNNLRGWKFNAEYMYRLLFSYNSLRGNIFQTEKLYEDYKRRGFEICPKIYTSIFFACAKNNDRDKALSLATKVCEYMERKNYRPTVINYNAMLMAFGKHGDIKTSFRIFDSVVKQNGKATVYAYNHLFDACLTDKNSGLRLALLIWHKMLQSGVRPTQYSFQAIVRCARECSLGCVELIPEFLNQFSNYHELSTFVSSDLNTESLAKVNELNGPVECSSTNTPNNSYSSGDNNNELVPLLGSTNFLLRKPIVDSNFKTDSFLTPASRLALLGGVKGVLDVASHFNVKCNLKLFTTILGCLPATSEAEDEILNEVMNRKIPIDTAFLNAIIKRKVKRGNIKTPGECISFINNFKRHPDTITLGIAASTCNSRENGVQCIELARKYRIRLNSIILETLLIHATKLYDMQYISDIITAVKEDEVTVSHHFISRLRNIVLANKKFLGNLDMNMKHSHCETVFI